MLTYGKSLNSTQVEHTHFVYMLPTPMCAYTGINAHQRITVTGNDVVSSPPSSVLHVGLFTLHLFISVCTYTVVSSML